VNTAALLGLPSTRLFFFELNTARYETVYVPGFKPRREIRFFLEKTCLFFEAPPSASTVRTENDALSLPTKISNKYPQTFNRGEVDRSEGAVTDTPLASISTCGAGSPLVSWLTGIGVSSNPGSGVRIGTAVAVTWGMAVAVTWGVAVAVGVAVGVFVGAPHGAAEPKCVPSAYTSSRPALLD